MVLDDQVERVLPQFGQDAGRVTETHHPLTSRHQALKQVIDGEIARSARQYLLAAAYRLANHLYYRGRLAGARRAVDNRQIPGCQSEAHRLLLGDIERLIKRREGNLRVERGRLL